MMKTDNQKIKNKNNFVTIGVQQANAQSEKRNYKNSNDEDDIVDEKEEEKNNGSFF